MTASRTIWVALCCGMVAASCGGAGQNPDGESGGANSGGAAGTGTSGHGGAASGAAGDGAGGTSGAAPTGGAAGAGAGTPVAGSSGTDATGGSAGMTGGDSGVSGAGDSDAGSSDAGNSDAGTVDAGDSGPGDSGSSDAGDGGASGDGGIADSGTGDAGASGSSCPGPSAAPDAGAACAVNGPPIPLCSSATKAGPLALLDDFEDCDRCLPPQGGRYGFWFGFDSTGWLTPEVVFDAERQSQVMRAVGVIDASIDHWGLAVWPSTYTYCDEKGYDLSAYDGIEFWVRSVSGATIKLMVRDDATASGTDLEGATSPTLRLPMSSDWEHYQVHWQELTRELDSTPADPSSIRIIKWEGADDDASYELLLDDVQFFHD